MNRGRLLVGAVVVSMSLGVSSCGSSADAPAEPEGVSVEVLQYRRDEADRVVEVKVRNDGRSQLQVDRVELLATGFDGAGAVQAAATVPPGQAVDLRVPYGEPACVDDGPEPGLGESAVRLWLEGSDEPMRLATRGDVLQRIHERDCSARAAQDVVPMVWSDGWRRQGTDDQLLVRGELDLGPVAAGRRAEVTDVRGTTLFTLAVDGLPVTLEAGGTASVPVTFRPARCDPHAVGESKRGYAFGVEVVLDGAGSGDAVLVTVQPDEAARALLEQALLERCGLTS